MILDFIVVMRVDSYIYAYIVHEVNITQELLSDVSFFLHYIG